MDFLEKDRDAALLILRSALNRDSQPISESVDWKKILKWFSQEGLTAICFDGVQKQYSDFDISIPQPFLIRLIDASARVENNYARQLKALNKIKDVLASHKINIMVLKGISLSELYPVPNHRFSSDVDVHMFGDERKADKILFDELNINVDTSHHHHTVFSFDGVGFENHYDFINVHANSLAPWLEKRFKELAATLPHMEHDGVFFPNPTLSALFLLRHTAQHFAAEKMMVRMIIDWALFCEKYNDVIDWDMVKSCADNVGLSSFLNHLNECADALLKPAYIFTSPVAKRVWDDTWFYVAEREPKGVFKRYSFMFRRWWKNRWKKKLVYKGSLFKQFFVLWRSHLIKPNV